MTIIDRLRGWWQQRTGEEETPFDGDVPAWVISMLFHLALLLAVGLYYILPPMGQLTLSFTVPLDHLDESELPENFFFNLKPAAAIGANGFTGVDAAFPQAPILSDDSEIPMPQTEISPVGQVEINETIQVAMGLHYNKILAVKGAVGVGTSGTGGAIDRLTQEILLSLEERKTLVLWLFDQSGSLAAQREEIISRFDKIYEELGVIQASKNPAFKKDDDKPLLTSVFAFGLHVTERIDKPTDDVQQIKQAVAEIPRDESGTEKVFSAIYMAVDKYKKHRLLQVRTRRPRRNVMVIVFTDEAGNDQEGLELTVKLCRRYAVPVYVVGVPAPFGRKETMVKWVDPDPQFDQTPKEAPVTQGPESMLPERVKIHFSGRGEDTGPLDSGFGPFSLTRLCYETGGIYFANHPNRRLGKAVSRGETAAMSAYIKHFFDPRVMRQYRPDYVSQAEYLRQLAANKARATLVQAAEMSWINPMARPRLRFVKRSEAALANTLSEAQKAAAKLEPKIGGLYEVLKMGEADRKKEQTPRWQAGYDLAMGRVMAVKVRTESYNAMLAKAKRGLKFKDKKNNTWILRPSNDLGEVGSQLEKVATKAHTYLEHVVQQHPNTPWALLAQRELKEPLGWQWTEFYTHLNPPSSGNNGNGSPAPPNDDQLKMLNKPKPRRGPPKL